MARLVKDAGPKSARVCIIGEAPGAVEAQRGIPFVGPSGQKLSYWLSRVGLSRPTDCYITNTYPYQPPGNKLALIPGDERATWITKLHERIAALPNLRVIVPMGNYALEALVGKTGILNHRGSIYEYTTLTGRKVKVIPSLHPAFTLSEPSKEAVCIRDWEKIAAELKTEGVTRIKRLLEIKPTVADVADLEARILADPTRPIAVDIETPALFKTIKVKQFKNGNWQKRKEHAGFTIACIGFALSSSRAMSIPLTRAYWSTTQQWETVKAIVARILASKVPKIFQYGWFDTYCLKRLNGWKVRRWLWDTKDMHHCLEPNDQHSLAYMASRYTTEPYWKDEGKGQGKGIPRDLLQFWEYNCVEENTRVLTADFRWKKIKNIQVGDLLLAPDEHGGRQGNGELARRWRVAEVKAKRTAERTCDTVTTSSGRSLTLTRDHRVLAGKHGKRWVEAGNLRCDTLRSWLNTAVVPWKLNQEEIRNYGWVGGMFDGEGSLSGITQKAHQNFGLGYLSISQKPGLVLTELLTLLEKHGFQPSKLCRTGKTQSAFGFHIKGGVRAALRALGLYRPLRLMAAMRAIIEKGKVRCVSLIPERVEDIKAAGMKKVVDIETTTGTFIAEGFVVHNCKDVAVTWELYAYFRQRLEAEGKLDFYKHHYRALYRPVLAMSLRGMRMDEARRQDAAARYAAICADLKDKLTAKAGTPLYGGKGSLSPQKLQTFLYDTLNLKEQLKKDKATGTLKRTADEVAVRRIQRRYGHKQDIVQVCQWILDVKRHDKLRQFVSEKLADADGRMRSSYSISTVTGRFASGKNALRTGGNAQNIDREIRDMYLPDVGCLMLEADLSQAEARIVFMLTGDKELVKLARTPPWEYDVHTANAARLFHVPESDVTKTMRYLGKRAVHAGHYGMQGKKLSDIFLLDGYAVPEEESQKLIDTYLEWREPIVTVFQRETRQTIMRDRMLRNPWGRTISFQYDRLNDELYRLGYAWVPQSTVPDIINRWGIPVLKTLSPKPRLHLQGHDSLVMSVRPAAVWSTMQALQHSLEQAIEYCRPLGGKKRSLTIPVEFKLSTRWASARAAKDGDVIEWKQPPTEGEVAEAVKALVPRMVA